MDVDLAAARSVARVGVVAIGVGWVSARRADCRKRVGAGTGIADVVATVVAVIRTKRAVLLSIGVANTGTIAAIGVVAF